MAVRPTCQHPFHHFREIQYLTIGAKGPEGGIKVWISPSRRLIARFLGALSIVLPIAATPSSATCAVAAMKMLTPEVGWAKTGGSSGENDALWWTEDGGSHWKDITPRSSGGHERPILQRPGGHVSPVSLTSIFFPDTHRGWVLMCPGDTGYESTDGDLPRYDLATTNDAGATWSIARISIPREASVPPGMDFYAGEITFADTVHGWLNVTGSAGHSAWGVLLITSDGGKRWRVAEAPPGGAGPIYLVSPNEGWQLTGPSFFDPDETELSVTRDGARSWHNVNLPIPNELLGVTKGSPPPTAHYDDLPRFDRNNSQHGVLTVTYKSDNANAKATLVLFETHDSGRTWNAIRAIKDFPWEATTVDIVDSRVIAVTGSFRDKTVTLLRDGPEGRSQLDLSSYFPKRSLSSNPVSQISFATTKCGWMLGPARLFSTGDGGTTWRELKPEPHHETINSLRFVPGGQGIEDMQLVTNDAGWALSSIKGHLFWTEDGGIAWKDITPPGTTSSPQRIVSAFFLNDKQGWALAPGAVFSTADSGAHWSMTDLSRAGLVDLSQATEVAPFPPMIGRIDFSDSLHGWISLATTRIGYGRSKWLLKTSDGGRTWQLAPGDPGYAGMVHGLTSDECWMRSYQGDTLSVTRDGGKSWENIAILPPEGIDPGRWPNYELPMFKDSRQGFLVVTYSAEERVQSGAVLFTTDDGGRTWKADRRLTELGNMTSAFAVSSAMVGDEWIAACVIGRQNPTLVMIPKGATVASTSDYQAWLLEPRQLSFISPSRGWALLRYGRIVSTSDGGKTWTEMRPEPMPPRPAAPYLGIGCATSPCSGRIGQALVGGERSPIPSP
jgi:photosystem II stability/assembly factor-like uncharacterized protein